MECPAIFTVLLDDLPIRAHAHHKPPHAHGHALTLTLTHPTRGAAHTYTHAPATHSRNTGTQHEVCTYTSARPAHARHTRPTGHGRDADVHAVTPNTFCTDSPA